MSIQKVNRRKFLTLAGVTGLGIGVAAACSPSPAAATPTAVVPPAQPTPDVGHMDTEHQTGVTDFVNNLAANNKIFWTPRMPFTLDGDTKVFQIICQEVDWETKTGEDQSLFLQRHCARS